ncbi:MAG: hypothetical protein BWY83_03253 [bacterium ADurb.Bin478]|nr:MAG: hypothetical protein BWY83_03253 [bacterium ADurb.Bin478]
MRLNNVVGTIAAWNGNDLFNLAAQQALFRQVQKDFFSGFKTIQSAVGAGLLIHPSGGIDDRHRLQTVTSSHLEIIEIVGGCDFDRAAAERRVRMLVRDQGDFAMDQRQHQLPADQVAIALILRMDRHRRIAQHGLRARGGHNDLAGSVLERVRDVPQFAVLIAAGHLFIGQRGMTARTPIDETPPFIDQALVVQPDKHLAYGAAEILIHGKTFPLPVAGGAQLAQLLQNDAAEFFLPLPDPLEKLFPAKLMPVQPLLRQRRLHLVLSGDAGVVGAGHPQRLVPLHFFPADQQILQCVV